MDQWLSQPGSVDPSGFAAGPAGIAHVGIALFLLLGLYALLLLNSDRLPSWLRLPSPAGLRPRLTVALVLVATLPAISLALVLSDRASRQRTDRAAASLQAQADGTARSLAYLLEKTQSGVAALAQHVERAQAFTTATASRQLLLHHEPESAVESMAAVSQDGTVIAATRRVGARPMPFTVPSGRLADNTFIGSALRSGVPQTSGAEREPLLGRRPAILISAPVRSADGAAWGIVVAAFDPASVSALQNAFREELAGGLLIADKGLGVVLATPSADGESQPDSIRDAVLGPGRPDGRPFLFSLRSADGATQDFIGAPATAGDGWRVVRYAPMSALHAASLEEYGVALGWLLAAMIVSVCLAVALAGSISGPLSALDMAVRQFDPELDRELPKPPANAPREVVVVFEHLATVAERLRHSYGQLRQSLRQGERLRSELIHVIENREQEIEGRTEQLKAANATLDRLSRIDALTGVANRRGFAEYLDRAWRSALRDEQPLSILMIDIDYFKAYNDTYGHQQGDTCLKAVADAICHVAGRASDIVSRYGGEEFVAVLGNTPLEGALQVGEQIRAAVQGLAIPHGGTPNQPVVTVSVGVTSTLPTRGTRSDACLVAADRALYAAKEQGRNQVGYSTSARTGLFQSLCLPNDPAAKPS